MKNTISAISVLTIGLIIAVTASGATFNVTTTNDTLDANPGDGICADAVAVCSLRAAIGEANALTGADMILLVPGTYTQTLIAGNEDANAGGDWDITSAITIIGTGEFSCAVEAATSPGIATERVINVREGGDLTLRRLTVRNGNFSGTMTASTRGAGIENRGILTLDRVVVRDNQITSINGDPYGAGIHNAGPALTMISSSIIANTITQQTGGNAFGGGIASTSETNISITDGFIGNSAFANRGFVFGAGIYLENRFTVNMTGCAVAHNTAAGTSGGPDGGGVNGSGVSAVLNRGPAVFNAARCTFRDNSAAGPRGGGQGVGLYFLTSATDGSTLTATLDGVTVKDNSGTSSGGGIGATVNGGRLILNIFNSSITNNIGAVLGGGIFVTDAGPRLGPLSATINLRNSTVSGNVSSDLGGGLYLSGSLSITANLNHVTIANNTADRVGGIVAQFSSIVNLKNSIVGDNFGGFSRDIAGTIISGDYNHIENVDEATIIGITTNNTTGDAILGPLVEHVGGGAVHMPGAASPVVNAIPSGTNDCGTSIIDDQRGVLRPQGGGCDKGSVERAVSATIAGRVTTPSGFGIRNAVLTLSGGSLTQPIVIQTGSLGLYSFPDLPGEETYRITVRAKRFQFCDRFGDPVSRSVYLASDVLNVDFQSNPDFDTGCV